MDTNPPVKQEPVVTHQNVNSGGLLPPPEPPAYIPISVPDNVSTKWFTVGLSIMCSLSVLAFFYMAYKTFIVDEPLSNPFSSSDKQIEYVSYKISENQPASFSKVNKFVNEGCEYRDLKEALREAGKVCSLYLNSSDLTSLPNNLNNFPNLKTLDLSNNDLIELDPEIGNLLQLTTLDLSRNQLKELPLEVGNISDLKSLSLAYNKITVIPSEISNLSNLEFLDLVHNPVNNLPDEIKNLKNLKTLEIEEGQFSKEELQRIKSLLPNTKIKLKKL